MKMMNHWRIASEEEGTCTFRMKPRASCTNVTTFTFYNNIQFPNNFRGSSFSQQELEKGSVENVEEISFSKNFHITREAVQGEEGRGNANIVLPVFLQN
jgi:hypothetical protein